MNLFNSKYLVLSGLIVALLLVLVNPTYVKMREMTSNEMGQVTGKEGLAIDLGLDFSAGKYFLNDGGGDKLLFQGITLDNGSGGQANLNGFTVDADGSDGLVFGAPNGTFRADFNIFCTESASTADCDGSLDGADEAYGRLEARGIGFGNSSINFSGRGDGLTGENPTADFEISELRFYDRNGLEQNQTAGNVGVLEFNDMTLSDRNGSAQTLENPLTFDVDGSGGIVVSIPSEPNPEPDGSESDGNDARPAGIDFEIDDVYVGNPSNNPPGTSFGKFWVENFSMTGFNGEQSRIRARPNGEGVTIDGQFFFNAHRIAWQNEDENATAQLGATSGGGEFRIHDGSNNPVSFNDLSIGFEDPEGIVIDMTPDVFSVDIPHTDLGTGGPGAGVFLDDLQFGFDAGNETVLSLGGLGEGITMDLGLEFDLENLDLVDNDGLGGGNAGAVRFGEGNEIEFGNPSDETNPVNFTDITLNADPSDGAIVGLPSENFQLQINDIAVGERGGSFGSSMGSILIQNATLGSGGNSEVLFNGRGSGLDLGVYLEDMSLDFTIVDEDGWDGGAGNEGVIFAKNTTLTLDDESGDPANINLDLDSSRGAIVDMQEAHIDFSMDTLFLGKDQTGNPSPVNGNLEVSGSQVDVFTR